MSYKVLVLDIDGTLMNSEKKITEKTKVALRAAQEAGVTTTKFSHKFFVLKML